MKDSSMLAKVVSALFAIVVAIGAWFCTTIYNRVETDHDAITKLQARDELYRGRVSQPEEAKITHIIEASAAK